MNNKKPIIPYALAVLSGISFVCGLVILTSEGSHEKWIDWESLYHC